MVKAGWSTQRVWEELAKIFDPATIETYRKLAADPRDAFQIVRENFKNEVDQLSRNQNDIQLHEAKKHLILGHLLLAVFQALGKGRSDWEPMPDVLHLPWDKQQTALLLWSSKHGSA